MDSEELSLLVEELRDRPLFICGHPKAGTSLLRAVLDSHPQLIVYPEETVFFRRTLPQLAGKDLAGQLELAQHTLIHIFQWSQATPHPSQAGFADRDYSAISFDQVRSCMEKLIRARYLHPGDLLSAAVLAYGITAGVLKPGLRFWVEKSPYNEFYTSQIFTWWPEARCVHILRDPRDNFASYRRKHPGWNAEFFASNWSRSTKAGLLNQEKFGQERYWFIRFEDLVRSPEEYVERLAAFLKISWDSALIHPTRAGDQWGGNSMFDEPYQSISTAPLDRRIGNLSPIEAQVISKMTGGLLQALDYPPEPVGNLGSHLVAHIRSLSWPLRRPFYHRRRASLAT